MPRQEPDVIDDDQPQDEPAGRSAASRGTTGVQSVERSVALLETLAENGGQAALSVLARSTGLPQPTIHRLLRTLVDLGLVRRTPSRTYALGPRLVPLGEGASAQLGGWSLPHLDRLMRTVGETANLAMFDRDGAVYLAQVPSRHSMRTFTEVGRHVDAHCTGVGKALLSGMPRTVVDAVLDRAGMARCTETTITDREELHTDLARTRERGYAIDEGEREVGVRCLAVRLPTDGAALAVSVSGPAVRLTRDRVDGIVPVLQLVAQELRDDLFGVS